MANHGYMTITGTTQGLISAGCSTQDSIGNKCQAGHRDEIMVLSLNHVMEHVANSKRATHQPIIITKNIDKSSPLLAQAMANLELLDCKVTFYRVSPHGVQERFYTIEINGARISRLMVDMPHAMLESDEEAQEQVSIRYRDISWVHHLAGTTGYSSWGETE
jgi:type VI secretion system Hcp family effector